MTSIKYSWSILGLILICSLTFASKQYTRAVVESCSGCALNRLSEVKKFVFEDVPKYENVEFKHIPGIPPELILYNDNDQAIESIPLTKMTREECNGLLISKGFKKLPVTKDEI